MARKPKNTFQPEVGKKYGGGFKPAPTPTPAPRPRSNEVTRWPDVVKLPIPSEPLLPHEQKVDTRKVLVMPRAIPDPPHQQCEHGSVTGPRFPMLVRPAQPSTFVPPVQTITKPRNIPQAN